MSWHRSKSTFASLSVPLTLIVEDVNTVDFLPAYEHTAARIVLWKYPKNLCLFEHSDESVEAKSRTEPPRLLFDSRDNVCWAREGFFFLGFFLFWLACEKSKKHCLQCTCARKALCQHHLTYCLYNPLNWHIFHLGNRAINHWGWCFSENILTLNWISFWSNNLFWH